MSSISAIALVKAYASWLKDGENKKPDLRAANLRAAKSC